MQFDLEKWLEKRLFPRDGNKSPEYQSMVVREADIRALFAGKVLCDAEPVKRALEAVECALQVAHNSAYPVCCGRSRNGECCGDPEPEWDEADMAIMDTLGPMQKALETLCRNLYAAAAQEGGSNG